MLCLYELMANGPFGQGVSAPNQGTRCSVPRRSVEQGSFAAFRTDKMGTSKMDRRDQELLDKQMRRLTPPRNDGVIAVLLAAMFLVGMTLGGVLSAHKSEPIQIASMD
jgi:hypothetical protein